MQPAYSTRDFAEGSLVDGSLPDDFYRLTIRDNITDPWGNALDGDMDGQKGGEWVRQFVVDAAPDNGVHEGRDNNSFDRATPLALEEDANGTGWFRSKVGYGSIGPNWRDDEDWYSFEAMAGDQVDVWKRKGSEDRWFVDSELHRLLPDGTATELVQWDRSSGQIPDDGSYFLKVFGTGDLYEIRLHLNRLHSIEPQDERRNDNISFRDVDPLPISGDGQLRTSTIGGTLFSTSASRPDRDYFGIGYLTQGSTVQLDVSVPTWSTVDPVVELVDENDNVVSDENSSHSVFSGSIVGNGEHYARVTGTQTLDTPITSQYLLSASMADFAGPSVKQVDGLPLDGKTLDNFRTSFSLIFNENIDPTKIVDGVFELIGAGVDGRLDTDDDVAYQLETRNENGNQQIRFDMVDSFLANGLHRFRLRDSITDPLGNAIDGDGDGLAGGDFVREFYSEAIPENAVFANGDNLRFEDAIELMMHEDPNQTGWHRSELGLGNIDAFDGVSSDDQHWYSFNVLDGDTVDIYVNEISGATKDVRFFHRSEEGAPIDSSIYFARLNRDNTTEKHYRITLRADDTFYIRVDGGSGAYGVQLSFNRLHQVESEDSISGRFDDDRDVIGLQRTPESSSRTGTVAGTLGGLSGRTSHNDMFGLGRQKAGTQVELDAASLPFWSRANPIVRLMNESGEFIYDTNPLDSIFSATLDNDGEYFVQVGGLIFEEGSKFQIGSHPRRWLDAEAAAIAAGGRLISIDSAELNDEIANRIGGGVHWIGLSDTDNDGVYTWSDGTPLSFTNWTGSPPTAASDDYVFIDSSGFWQTANNDALSRFGNSIIEYPTSTDDPPRAVYSHSSQYVLSATLTDNRSPIVDSVRPNRFSSFFEPSLIAEEAQIVERSFNGFIVSFSEEMNANSITGVGFELVSAGVDGEFDTLDDQSYALNAYRSSQQRQWSVSKVGSFLADGLYRFTVRGSANDLFGNVLDGNRDGTAGGDDVRYFVIDAIPDNGVFEGDDNETFETATPLSMLEDSQGTGWYRGETGYGELSWGSDQDWFSFDALAGDHVDIWVRSLDRDSAQITLERLSEDGLTTVSMTSDWNGSASDRDVGLISAFEIPDDGTYFIRVRGNSDSYRVRVNLNRLHEIETDGGQPNEEAGSAADDLIFRNDGAIRSTSVAGTIWEVDNDPVETDRDTYQLGTLAPGETVVLTYQLPSWSGLEPVIEIIDENDNLMATTNSTSGGVIRVDVQAPGPHFARISTSGEADFDAQYVLSVSIQPTNGLSIVESFAVENNHPSRSDVRTWAIQFNQTMQLSSMIDDGSIVDAIAMISLGMNGDENQPVVLHSSDFTIVETDTGTRLVWSIESIGDRLDDGYYHVMLDEKAFFAADDRQLISTRPLPFHQLRGDIDGNAVVNGRDMAEIISSVNSRSDDERYRIELDLNEDGRIDLHDRLIILQNRHRALGNVTLPPREFGSNPSWFELDVSGDGFVTPLDALRVINQLNRDAIEVDSTSSIDVEGAAALEIMDVNNDGSITASDALQIINELDRHSSSVGLSYLTKAAAVTNGDVQRGDDDDELLTLLAVSQIPDGSRLF